MESLPWLSLLGVQGQHSFISPVNLTKAFSFAVGNSDRFISTGNLMRENIIIDITDCVNVMSEISYYSLYTHQIENKLLIFVLNPECRPT